MTVPLTGAGSLFVRLGHVFGPARDLLALMGGAATANIASGARFPAQFTNINTDLAAGTALPKLAARSTDAPYTALAAWQGQQSGLFSWVKQVTTDILSAMVALDQGLAEDAPIPQASLLPYLINQMFFASAGSYAAPTATLQSCTLAIGAQTAGLTTPAGNPTIVLGTKNVLGQILQLVFPETISFTCTKDQQGGAAAGNETLSFAGYVAAPGPFSQLYPAGSGCAGTVTLVDGSKSNSAGNLLTNPFLVATTANIADNWTNAVGVAGTDIFVSTTGGYKTASGYLEFTGTGGAVLDAVSQSFATAANVIAGAGGTPQALLPDTQYCFSAWIKVSPSTPAAGVVTVSLQDGAGNTLNDDTGAANSQTFDLTAGGLNISTTWVNIHCIFRTPANLTTQTGPFKLFIALSTAITSGKSVLFSCPSFTPMVPLYAGGPPCAAFSGSIPVLNGLTPDQWTFAITNTYGQFSLWLDRIFGLRALGLQFPYSGSPTVADSLIS